MIFLWLMLMLVAGVALTSLVCVALLVAGDEEGGRCPDSLAPPRGVCAPALGPMAASRGAP